MIENTNNNLVNIKDFNLNGSNFYFHKYAAHGLSEQDILDVGIISDDVFLDKEVCKLLQKINEELLRELGLTIYIKEGYRSKSLYEMIFKRRVEKYGLEETQKLLNMKDMPHATGLTADICLWSPVSNKEVYMRNGKDGINALFIDFYKNKESEDSKKYHHLQVILITVMQKYGFRLGTKREYFHFDYKPETPENY